MEWRFFTENALENRRKCSDSHVVPQILTPPTKTEIVAACVIVDFAFVDSAHRLAVYLIGKNDFILERKPGSVLDAVNYNSVKSGKSLVSNVLHVLTMALL